MKDLWCSIKATADAADNGKTYTPKLSERKFCDGLEIKFTSPLGEIQQAGARCEKRYSLFYLRLVITSG